MEEAEFFTKKLPHQTMRQCNEFVYFNFGSVPAMMRTNKATVSSSSDSSALWMVVRRRADRYDIEIGIHA